MQMVIVASLSWSGTGKIAVGHCLPISNLEQKKITMENIIKIISSFGWPHVSLIFSLIFIIVFYRSIREFIGKIKSVGKEGLKTESTQLVQVEEKENKPLKIS